MSTSLLLLLLSAAGPSADAWVHALAVDDRAERVVQLWSDGTLEAWAKDRRLFAVSVADCDVARGAELGTLALHGPSLRLAISCRVGGADLIAIRDAHSGAARARVPLQGLELSGQLAFDAAGARLVAPGAETVVVDVARGVVTQRLDQTSTVAGFSADGRVLGVFGEDAFVAGANGEATSTALGELALVCGVAGATVSGADRLRLASHRCSATWEGLPPVKGSAHVDGPFFAVGPDARLGLRLQGGQADGELVDLVSGSLLRKVRLPRALADEHAALSTDGAVLVVGGRTPERLSTGAAPPADGMSDEERGIRQRWAAEEEEARRRRAAEEAEVKSKVLAMKSEQDAAAERDSRAYAAEQKARADAEAAARAREAKAKADEAARLAAERARADDAARAAATQRAAAEARRTGCVEGTCRDGTGTWRDADGTTYRGTFRSDKTGVFEVSKPGQPARRLAFLADRLLGECEGNCIEGEGVLRRPDGVVQRGTFSSGALHPRGVEELPDGTRYEGRFAYGQRDTLGVEIDGKGKRRIVLYDSGRLVAVCASNACDEDTAHLRLPDGSDYRGEHDHGVPNGVGRASRGKKVDDGLWDQGKLIARCLGRCTPGKGAFRYLADGAEYRGEVLGPHRSGTGSLKLKSGEVKKGHWMFDELAVQCLDGNCASGRCHLKGEDFDWVGECVDGFPQGEGRWTLAGGVVVEGVAGSRGVQGEGVMRMPDGTTCRGPLDGNRRHGVLQVEGPGGPRREVFRDDLSVGRCLEGDCWSGTGTLDTGQLQYTGPFREGQPHGRGKARLADGFSFEGSFEDGKPGKGAWRDAAGLTLEQADERVQRQARAAAAERARLEWERAQAAKVEFWMVWHWPDDVRGDIWVWVVVVRAGTSPQGVLVRATDKLKVSNLSLDYCMAEEDPPCRDKLEWLRKAAIKANQDAALGDGFNLHFGGPVRLDP